MRFLSSFRLSFLFILFITTLSGCSSTSSNVDSDARDPIEKINRASWRFTWDYADKYVLKPTAKGYAKFTPKPVRKGIYNVALNLSEPASFINNLLQAKFTDAATTSGRFIVNSTIGIFGIFDVAKHFGWKRKAEEFGEVLGSYGVGDGPYVVIPGLGPSSVREETGDFVDRAYWPLAIIDFWPNIVRLSVLGLEQRIAIFEQEALIDDAIDDYTFVKNAYFQSTDFKVHDGNPPIEIDESEEDDLDAYLEEFE